MTNPNEVYNEVDESVVVELVALKEEGCTLKKARGYLVFNYEIEGKVATELLKEAGFTTGTKGGGLTDTMRFLEECPRTEDELYRYILENGTKNEARWIAQRNSIRLLAVSIYEKYNEEFIEVAASKEMKDAVKEMHKA